MSKPFYRQYPITVDSGKKQDFKEHIARNASNPGIDIGTVEYKLYMEKTGKTIARTGGWEEKYSTNTYKIGNFSIQTMWVHLSSFNATGLVKEGTQIGVTGNTGASSGFHTHLSLWINGTRVDPEPYYEALFDEERLYERLSKDRPDVVKVYNKDTVIIWWTLNGHSEFVDMLKKRNRIDVLNLWNKSKLFLLQWYLNDGYKEYSNIWNIDPPTPTNPCQEYIDTISSLNDQIKALQSEKDALVAKVSEQEDVIDGQAALIDELQKELENCNGDCCEELKKMKECKWFPLFNFLCGLNGKDKISK